MLIILISLDIYIYADEFFKVSIFFNLLYITDEKHTMLTFLSGIHIMLLSKWKML